MSVADQITRIQTNIANAYSSCEAKGAILPKIQNSDNLASVIDSIVGGSSSGGGATVTAVNKTGTVINVGDKVWLNDNYRIVRNSYTVKNTNSIYASNSCILSRSGNWAWSSDELYSIGTESATYQGSLTADVWCVKYMADKSLFLMGSEAKSYRIDEVSQYTIDYRCIKDDYFADSSKNVVQLNLIDGSIKKTLGVIDGSIYELFKIGDNFYTINSSGAFKYVYNGESFEKTQITVNKATTFYPLDTTADNKYVIGADSSDYGMGRALRIAEIINENEFKVLEQNEYPVFLQDFYSYTYNEYKPALTFNPYTGILTVAKYNTSEYVIAQYENGTWKKIHIDLGLYGSKGKFEGILTVSDDLTRVCYNYNTIGNDDIYLNYINNLDNLGYAAVPYRLDIIDTSTLTGYAGNDTEPNEEITVGIASVPGSTPSVTGGSDTFEAQLILDNVVNSGILKTEEEVVNETVAVLKDILGE